MARLRVGVIGTGQWARAAHLPAFSTMPEVELVAVAGVERPEAEAAARQFGVSQVFDSGLELIELARPDLVSIVTPDDCHVPDAQAALAAGLHVLCEKPLAVTVADARRLAEQAATSTGRTKMGFTLRYAPSVIRLRELVNEGAIGTPQLVKAFQQNGQFLDPNKPFHWKMDGSRTGGGAIVEYGIHTLDLMRWILGEMTRVSATGRTLVPERPFEGGTRVVEVDDSTACLMEFVNGAIGMCHAGWSTVGRAPGLELRVYGSNGALKCLLSDDLPGGEGLWMADANEQRFEPAEIPARLAEGLPLELPWWRRFSLALIRDFIAEIDGRSAPSATFADGLAAQELLDAVIMASREKRWVDVAG